MQHGKETGVDIDVAKVAEVWRHGSVVRSWLLDLIASALSKDPKLATFKGHVSDSGEGRWTVQAAVDAAVPVPVLFRCALLKVFVAGEDEFANRLLSAMRKEFGGHVEPKAPRFSTPRGSGPTGNRSVDPSKPTNKNGHEKNTVSAGNIHSARNDTISASRGHSGS